jgi:hypothetical protein
LSFSLRPPLAFLLSFSPSNPIYNLSPPYLLSFVLALSFSLFPFFISFLSYMMDSAVVGSGGCNDNGIDASYLAELLNDTATDDFDMASRATPNDPDEVMLFGGHLNVSGEHQSVHSVTATTDLPIAPVQGMQVGVPTAPSNFGDATVMEMRVMMATMQQQILSLGGMALQAGHPSIVNLQSPAPAALDHSVSATPSNVAVQPLIANLPYPAPAGWMNNILLIPWRGPFPMQYDRNYQ